MSRYTRFPDPAGGIKIYPSPLDFPTDPGRDGVQAVDASTNSIYIYDLATTSWSVVANPGASVAITGLNSDVSATGPGVVNATVNSIGGASAADVATSVSDTQAATNAATPNTLVKRDLNSQITLKALNLDGATSGTLNIYPAAAVTNYSVTLPAAQGAASSVLQNDGAGNLSWGAVAPVGNYITALTGEVTASGPGSAAATIAANAVTNSKLAQIATQTIKGRTTAGVGDVEDLTASQATAILNAMVGDSGAGGTKGLVPAPAAGDAQKVLNGAGTWQYAGLADGTLGTLCTVVGRPKPTNMSGARVTIVAAGSGINATGESLTTGIYNTLIGPNVGSILDTGSYNTLIGVSIATSAANTNNAVSVGTQTTVGTSGTAVGNGSRAGTRWVSLGDSAGNTNGNDNIAIGGGSIRNNTTGSYNIGIGNFTLNAAGLGSNNVAIGYFAGRYAVSSNELYIGNQAYASNAVEKTNSLMYGQFNGTPSLQTLTINAAVTATYGITSTTVKQNGATSGTLTHAVPATVTSYTMTYPSAQGAANTYLKNDGSGNLSWATAGVVTVAGDAQKVLASDGTTTAFYYAGLGGGGFGTNNVFLGKGKPAALTTSTNNIIVSPSTSGDGITTGSYNVILSDTGLNAGNVSSMVAIGTRLDSFGAFKTVLIGDQAKLGGANSYESVIIGYNANGNNAAFNTIIGSSASTTGTNATVLGYAAAANGFNYTTAIGNAATSGNGGTSLGYAARSLGTYSTAVGAWAGNGSDSGSYNTWIGAYSAFGAAKSGSNNVTLGYECGYSLTSASNCLFLGYRAGYRSTTQSSELFIDNQDRTTYALQQTNALVYGVFNATPSSQTLTANAVVKATYGVSVTTAGYGLAVKEGSNAKMGTATLAAGTVTVSTTAVTANSRIFLTVQSLGTILVPVAVAVTSRTAGASFVITSADVTDTSVVAWMIVEPA